MKTKPILLGLCALLLAAAVSAEEAAFHCNLPAVSQMEDAPVLPWDSPAPAEALSSIQSVASLPGDARLSLDCPEDPPNCCRWMLEGDCFICIFTC